jgi:hypothetical protein
METTLAGAAAGAARRAAPFLAALMLAATSCRGGAQADPRFHAEVQEPTFRGGGPVVLVDGSHRNRHTLDGRYAPLGALLAADGWRPRALSRPFEAASLQGARVLVVAGARGEEAGQPAFRPEEEEAVVAFVREGGSLLLVADHTPFAEAVAPLARRFGIEVLDGEVQDEVQREPGTRDLAQLLFERGAGTLGVHPSLEGRGPAERVERVVTFTGVALRAPPPAVPLLVLSPTARDLVVVKIEVDRGLLDTTTRTTLDGPVPTRGNAQMAALSFGRGRVVVSGEAAVFTSQVEKGGQPFGLDWPGAHNRRLALGVVRWLGGALEGGGR